MICEKCEKETNTLFHVWKDGWPWGYGFNFEQFLDSLKVQVYCPHEMKRPSNLLYNSCEECLIQEMLIRKIIED